MTAQVKLYAIIAALVVASGSYIGWRAHVRADAVNALVTQQERAKSDSIQKVHVRDSLALVQASVRAHDDSVRVQAANARVQATVKRTDSATAILSSLRDSALAMVRDSEATIAGLKGEVIKLATAITANQVTQTAERVAWQNDTSELHRQLNTRTTERDLAIKDRNDLSDEKASLAKQVGLLKASQPGFVGKYAGWATAGAAIIVAVMKK